MTTLAPAPPPSITATAIAVALPADRPFHHTVADVQRARAVGPAEIWITGLGAAAVAARLLRLLGSDLAVGVDLATARLSATELAATAQDAIALAALGGGRSRVRVADERQRRTLRAAVRAALETGRLPRPTRFGGDAFTATIVLASPLEVTVTAAAAHATAARAA